MFQLYHFNCRKISVYTSLDKNDKNTTSFTFSKIDSVNVKNNINNKREMRGHVFMNCLNR